MRFSVGCVALFAIASASMANLLTNGNLDDPGTSGTDLINGWTLTETPGFNSAEFADFANHTPGGEVGVWLRPWAGDTASASIPVDAQLISDPIPAIPGQQYELSAWFLFEEHYAGFSEQQMYTSLILWFYDASDSWIGGYGLSLENFGFNDGEWHQYSFQGVGYPDAATMRVACSMSNGVVADQNPQSAFADDFVLTEIPSPGALALAGLVGAGAARRRR